MCLPEDGSASQREKQVISLYVSTNGDEEYAIRRHINVQNAPTVTLHHWHHRMSIVIWKVRMKTAVTWSGFMPSCLTIIVHFYVRTLMTRAVSMATRMMFLLLWVYVEIGRFHTQLNVPALVTAPMFGYSLKNHSPHSRQGDWEMQYLQRRWIVMDECHSIHTTASFLIKTVCQKGDSAILSHSLFKDKLVRTWIVCLLMMIFLHTKTNGPFFIILKN